MNKDYADEESSTWMDRLLISVDESIKHGVPLDAISSVSSQLSDLDRQRFEDAIYCIQVLNQFRPPREDSKSIGSSRPQPAAPTSQTASLTSSRYEVQRILGEGAMGIVYAAFDQRRQEMVALKKLRHSQPSRILRFKQEFRRLANISHSNVVTLLELDQSENEWFISMELVDGTDLLSALGNWKVQEALAGTAGACSDALELLSDLFVQLAMGVNKLHDAGIVHRDLKPSNVLVAPNKRVVVIDFGLAASFDWRRLDETPIEELAGTIAYMAPEQFACESLTPACDWYSFGVMLYQAVTGSFPTTGPYSLLTKQYQPPRSLQETLPQLPAPWDDLCRRLLDPNPAARPAGKEVIERLRELRTRLEKDTVSSSHRLTLQSTETRAFVGREQERSQLHAAFLAAAAGQPTVATIQGTSGIGKTTLVETFLREVADKSCVILRGRCHERETLPFKTLDAVVDSLCKHLERFDHETLIDMLPEEMRLLRRMFPVLGSIGKAEHPKTTSVDVENILQSDNVTLRRRAFEALRRLLTNVAKQSPLIVFIDDLQWGDSPGAIALSDLFSTPSSAKMLFLLAHRGDLSSNNACIDSLQLHRLPTLGEPRVRDALANAGTPFCHCHIQLGPLREAEVRSLASTLINASRFPLPQSIQTDLPEKIASESSGMPFYVQEFTQYAIAKLQEDSQTSSVNEPTSFSLNDLLTNRIDSLATDARQLVSMVAVAGQPVALKLVCDAMGISLVSDRQIHELCVNRWLRTDRDQDQSTLTIYHDRIRENLIAGLPSETRQTLHAQLASTLEKLDPSTYELLAYHFDMASDPRRARHYFRLAAHKAQQAFAFEKAIEHYRRALELTTPDDDRLELIQSLGEAYSQAGRGGEAATMFLVASDIAATPDALELRLAAARQYCISGHTDEGRLLTRFVLANSGMYFPKSFFGLVISLIYQRLRLKMRGLKVVVRSEEQVPDEVLQRIDMMWSAVSGLSFQEPVAVASLHTKGLRAALEAGEPKRLARAIALEAILSSTPGPKTGARVQKLLNLADSIVDSHADSDAIGIAQLAHGCTAFLQVRMPDAVGPLAKAESLFASRVPKAWWELTTVRSLLTWAYMHMGDHGNLSRCVESYHQDALDRGDRFLLSSINSAGVPQLHLARDRADLAQQVLDDLAATIPYKQFQQCHVSMLYSQAQIDLYCGNGHASWQRIMDSWSLFRKSMQLQNQFARVSLIDLRARSALLAFNHKRDKYLITAVKRDLKRLKREVADWVRPYIHRLQAGIFETEGKIEDTIQAMEAASRGFHSIGFRSCAAATQRRQGQLMSNAAGQALIEQADEFLRSQGVLDLQAFQRILC